MVEESVNSEDTKSMQDIIDQADNDQRQDFSHIGDKLKNLDGEDEVKPAAATEGDEDDDHVRVKDEDTGEKRAKTHKNKSKMSSKRAPS